MTEAEDGRGGRTAFGLDGWGRVTAVHTAEGGTERYAYDYAGNLTGSVDAEGNGTAYAYDSRGNVCRITGPDGKSQLFAYDREGRLKRRTDRNGTVTEYRYNVDGRPVLEACTDRKGNRQVMGVWEYDSLGQLKRSAGGGRCYTYACRPDGKLLEKRENGRRLLTCSYYRNGSLRSLKDVTGRTARYEYDGEGRLSCLKEEDGKELASYEYTAAGRLSAVRTTAGLCASYRYDGDGNLVRLTLGEGREGEASAGRLYDMHLRYDLNGNRTERKGTRLGADGKVQEVETRYRYDRMDRLTEEDRKGEGERYAYDLNGNRTRKEHFQAGGVDWAETYCYNERNQLTERRNREGVSRYLYDPEGNLLKEKNGEKESVYRYDLLNRQTYLRTMEGREQENRYDGEGLRAGTVENGKAYTFLYHDGELLAECDGEGAAISRHVRGQGLSHIQTMGDSRYHACHRDEQGSTAYLTGEDGSVENSYLYDAFGNGLESLEGIRNRIKYTGQQYDPETGQYYLRARYYNPLIGRFTQEDTYRGDGLNLYAYCHNNPVTYYDPSGYTSRAERKTTKDRNGLFMGDIGYEGTLPTNSWTLTSDGMGAHLYERRNIAGRTVMDVFNQPDTPTYYPYGTAENAGQAHLRLHDATAGEGVKLSGGNSNLSDSELMNSYERAYSSKDLQNIRGDLRTGNESVVIATNVTPEEAFEKLNKWGMENNDDFKNFREKEMKKQKEEVADAGKCNS